MKTAQVAKATYRGVTSKSDNKITDSTPATGLLSSFFEKNLAGNKIGSSKKKNNAETQI